MRYPKGHVSEFDAAKYRKERRKKRADLGLCTRCDNPSVEGFTDCQNCMDEAEIYAKQLRSKCRELKICIRCSNPARPNALRCTECSIVMNQRNRNHHKLLKTQVLSYYGLNGKLQCCWEDCKIEDLDMLTLDHIENNGADHRKGYTKSGRGGGSKLYGLLIREGFPKGFQTLCSNHNLKKHILSL